MAKCADSSVVKFGLALLLAVGGAAGVARAAADDELKRLIEQIARADEHEAADAANRLVERVVGPVAEAFGSLESRPAEEQRRLRAVLARITAALRVRVFRADLSAAEAELLDRFMPRHAELVHRLFDPSFRVRLDALSSIPLEPNTAAGLLIAARVDDEDEEVAMAALDVAAELHDAVLGRRLVKYVQGATQAVRAGLYADDDDLAATVTLIAGRCCLILGECGLPEAVPVMTEALLFFGRSPQRAFIRVPELLDTLGKLGDERAVDALMAYVGERDLRYMRLGPQGQMILQLVGDTALLNLLRIYRLEPEAFGFLRAPDTPAEGDGADPIRSPSPAERAASPAGKAFYGLVDAAARERAIRMFADWHAANAKLAAENRRPPATQPREP